MINDKRGEDTELRCEFCEKLSRLKDVQVVYPDEPNTITPLKDINRVTWKCLHCGCWVDIDDFCDECRERRAQAQLGENARVNDPEEEFEE